MATVARRLGDLSDEVVFIGGSVLGILLDEPGGVSPRATDGVDVIVDVRTRAQYDGLTRRLRELGWSPDMSKGAPLWRWVVDDVSVDVRPGTSSILGIGNRWYIDAIAHAVERELQPGLSILSTNAPYFIAMKLEAFADRGNGDFMASHDMEDIITVIDGHRDLAGELVDSDSSLRTYFANMLGFLLDDEAFVAAVPGHLAGDLGTQARVPHVMSCLRSLAGRSLGQGQPGEATSADST